MGGCDEFDGFFGEVVCRYLILKGSNRYRNIKEPDP